jgi:hypothetical protein
MKDLLIAKILITIGSMIFIVLGGIHMFYTFFSNRFSPRNSLTETEMRQTSPVLTKQTTMWNAWIGFNASHSLGAIFFGAINILLTSSFFTVFENSTGLIIMDSITILFYFFLAKRFWFKIPLTGILLSGLCFTVAFILILIH